MYYCINRKKTTNQKVGRTTTDTSVLFSVFAIKLLSFTLYPFKILKCSKKNPNQTIPSLTTVALCQFQIWVRMLRISDMPILLFPPHTINHRK